jgi:hypothetical protein
LRQDDGAVACPLWSVFYCDGRMFVFSTSIAIVK